MTEDEIVRINVALRRFNSELEAYSKNFELLSFCTLCSSLMRRYRRSGRITWAPEYQVAQMIEANAAFRRRSSVRVFHEKDYRKLKNVFHRHENPVYSYLIGDDLGQFVLEISRQQIELQKDYTKPDLARMWMLFGDLLAGNQLDRQFEAKHGLRMIDWMKCGLAIFSTAVNNDGGIVRPLAIGSGVNITPEIMSRFLCLVSRVASDVGERYIRLRESCPLRCHHLVKSSFVDRPVMQIDDSQYFVPFPGVLFHYISLGLYEACKSLDAFSDEFGSALEGFVGYAIDAMPGLVRKLDQVYLEEISQGKSCDFVLEFESFIVLVESKAARFSRDVITDKNIRQDNSTKKIIRASRQIYETAIALRRGDYECCGISPDKKIVAVITTFDDIPFVNSDWYRDKYIEPEIGSDLLESGENILAYPPNVMSIRSLEVVVMAGLCKGASVLDLLVQRDNEGYNVVGDWDSFIIGLLKNGEVSEECLLPKVNHYFERAFSEIGASLPE